MKKTIAAAIAAALMFVGIAFACVPSTGIACKISSPTSYGTGVVLSNGYVLTAAHVVTNEREDGKIEKVNFPMVMFDDKSRKTARLERLDMKRDLALLSTKHQFQGVQVGENPQKGDCIWVVGCSGGLFNSIKRGIVSNFDGDFMAIDAIVSPGDSGGPVVNEAGELVGVTDAMLLSSGIIYTYGLAVNRNCVKDFLEGR